MDRKSIKIIVNIVFKSYPKLTIISLLAVIGTVILELPMPLFTMYFIDHVIPDKNLFQLNYLGGILLLILIVGLLIDYIRDYFSSLLAQKIGCKLGLKALDGVLHSNYLKIQENSTGYWLSRVTSDTQDISVAFDTLISIVTQILTFIMGICFTFYFSYKLGILIILLIPLYVFVLKKINPLLRKKDNASKEVSAKLTGLLEESIAKIIEIKSLFLENLRLKRSNELWNESINVNMDYLKFILLLGAFSNLISSIGSISILWYGGFMVITGVLTLGELIALNRFLGYVISPIQNILNLNKQLQSIFVSNGRIQEIISLKQTCLNADLKINSFATSNKLIVKNLNYSYDKKNTIFNNFSLTTDLKNFTGFVAPSGYGKSTLFKILAGLLVPDSGEIILQLKEKLDMKDVIVVSQGSSVFSDTFLNNLFLDRDIASDKLKEVIDIVCLNKMISNLPKGLNTELGSLEGKISGGEKQRIAIARAIIAEPKILLIDEMTSEIDELTEAKMFKALKEFRKDKITLFISHRESTLKHAEKIIELAN
ncbi:MAG: ATP-binding cassette domain-containing protein [Bacteroidales bacterium]|nr:ATP-binding cassette domain-containing protein [Bacteroidales bacterium]